MNEEQKNAAQRLGNPTLVVAGPGTGKTTTLIGRYQFLIKKYPSFQDLVLYLFPKS